MFALNYYTLCCWSCAGTRMYLQALFSSVFCNIAMYVPEIITGMSEQLLLLFFLYRPQTKLSAWLLFLLLLLLNFKLKPFLMACKFSKAKRDFILEIGFFFSLHFFCCWLGLTLKIYDQTKMARNMVQWMDLVKYKINIKKIKYHSRDNNGKSQLNLFFHRGHN